MSEAQISYGTLAVRELLTRGNTYVVTDEKVFALYGALFAGTKHFVVKAGEKQKNLSTVEKILADMTANRCDRKTTLVAVGGGVVGDTAGFAASIFMRGIKWINIPTTLLAQVDSSVGGKTGVDIKGYKNIAGSFWMPESVHICLDFLQTLPECEWLCGLGEIVKHACLDTEVYGYVLSNFDKLRAREAAAVEKAVFLNVRYKESVTSADFKELGLRKRLNAGHTIGHALEKLDGFKRSHGEYVALGLVAEAAMFKEIIDGEFYAAMCGIAKRVCADMPKVSAEKVLSAAYADKKNDGGKISFMIAVNAGSVREYLIDKDEFLRRAECIFTR